MEKILTSIIDLLESNASSLGLSYIDEEYGQVDALDSDVDTYPVSFPAVTIDSADAQWDEMGEGMQKGTATINVNIYLDCYDDTHAYSTTRSKVSERLALVNSVVTLLHGYEPIENGGMLIRSGSSTSIGNHGIKLYQTTFTMPVYEQFDKLKISTSTKTDVSPNITVTIKKTNV